MTIDATFWVAVSFFLFIGLLVYFKIPQKVNEILNQLISNIKNEINESEKLRNEAKTLLDNSQSKLDSAGEEANKIIDQAKKNKIDFQRLAASRSTGTDTDAFAYSNMGVASALISLPLRYMHTTVEMCSKDDVNSVIELIYQTLISLKKDQTFNYLK